MIPKEVLAFAKKTGAVMLDLKFMDLPGLWQHFSVPIDELNEALAGEAKDWRTYDWKYHDKISRLPVN